MADAGPSPRPNGADALSPTVAAARLGFAIILMATLAWGIWISSETDILRFSPTRAASARMLALGEAVLIGSRPMPAVRDFLSVTATPIGLAFLLLVRAEAPHPTMRARAIANAGLAAGIAVAGAGVGVGIWSVTAPPSGAMWGALAVAIAPLGVGGTLVLSAAALRDRESARGLLPYAITAALAIMVAAGAMGVRVAFERPPDAMIPMAVLTAAWPAGVGLLLLIAGEEVRSISRLSGWGVALGAFLAAAVLAAAIWFAVDAYSVLGAPLGDAYGFLAVIVQLAVLPMSIAFLGGVAAFGLKGREAWAGAPAVGWTASVLVALATLGFAARLIADADDIFWAMIGTLIAPLTIAATVAVAAQRCRQLRAGTG